MSTQTKPSQDTPVNNKWRNRAFKIWALVGACVLIGVVLYVCGIIWQAVAVVVVTVIIVFLLHGIVNALEKRKIPRWGGTTIAFLLVVLVIAGCLLAVIPAFIEQLTSFSRQLPTYMDEIQRFVSDSSSSTTLIDGESINKIIGEIGNYVKEQAGSLASDLANGVMGGLVSAGNFFLVLFISLICSFWILLDLPTITRELRSLISDKYQDDVDVITHAFGTAFYGWAKSTIICAVVTGIVSWLAFLIMGIPYSAVLGFLCGILYFVPYIGPMVSCALVALIALFVSPLICIISIVVNMVINNVVANILSPKLMKDSVNVYPALILVAILIGSALGGIPGMLLSIPVIGAIQGIFIAYFELDTGKQIATKDGVLFSLPTQKKNKQAPKLVKDVEEDVETLKDNIEDDVERLKDKVEHREDVGTPTNDTSAKIETNSSDDAE